MRNSMELRRTGDFWIDIGLIGLRKYLLLRSKGDISVLDDKIIARIVKETDLYDVDSDNDGASATITLSKDKLILDFDEQLLNEELSASIESIKPHYFGMSKSGKMWWQRLGRFFFGNQLPAVFFELPTRIVEQQKGKWKKGVCEFCGSDNRDVKQIGAGEHPLVVVPGKFSSFYSNLRGDTKICNWCAFASKFSPIELLYAVSSNSITVICIESDNLIDLSNVLNTFSRLFVQSEWYRNFPSVLRYTKYPLESFLDFLFATINEFEKKQDPQGVSLLKGSLVSKVHIIQGIGGQGLSIGKYYVIPNMPKVFDFISQCKWLDKNQRSYNCFFQTAISLISKQGTDINTSVREEFARRVFYNKDVSDLLEEFLIGKVTSKSSIDGFAAINIDKFIILFVLNQMGMDSRQLSIAKQLGGFIGQIAAKEDNKSLLYSLRSIGNLSSLLSYLNQLLVRYIDDVKVEDRNLESLLYEIDNKNWFTYKSLIGIFSVLQYKKYLDKKPNTAAHTELVNV